MEELRFATGGGPRYEVCQQRSGSSTHILAYAARISSYLYPMRRVMGSNNVTALHSFHSYEYSTVKLHLHSEGPEENDQSCCSVNKGSFPPASLLQPRACFVREFIAKCCVVYITVQVIC